MTARDGVADLDDARDRLVSFGLNASQDQVPLAGSKDRVLAVAIDADRDLPPFNRSAMDGIAIRASEFRPGVRFRILRTVAAGDPPGEMPPPGCGVRIATGAAVPEGLDTVVMRELLTVVVGGDVEIVETRATEAPPWRAIHRRGLDARAGESLVPAGCRVDPSIIALAATTGHSRLSVRTRPRCVILTTGDELREVDDPLEGDRNRYRIRDGNGPMLAATLQDLGAEIVRVGRVSDDLPDTRSSIQRSLGEADLCITVGGVSAGDLDFVPTAASDLGLHRDGDGVGVQPGRPFSWWTRGDALRVVGLPGNPVSALVCTHLFIRPWIDASLGLDPRRAWSMRRLGAVTTPNPGRIACRPSRFETDAEGRPLATVASWNGSGDLVHLAGTHGIARLPRQAEDLEVGTPVPTLPWSPTFASDPELEGCG